MKRISTALTLTALLLLGAGSVSAAETPESATYMDSLIRAEEPAPPIPPRRARRDDPRPDHRRTPRDFQRHHDWYHADCDFRSAPDALRRHHERYHADCGAYAPGRDRVRLHHEEYRDSCGERRHHRRHCGWDD